MIAADGAEAVKWGVAMETFEFTVVATDVDGSSFDRLADGGSCLDATVSLLRGMVVVDFAREADDAHAAVASATADVAASGARIVGVEPDRYATMADARERCGLGEKDFRELIGGSAGFPKPVARVTAADPLWDWVAVSSWLADRGVLSRAVAELAAAARKATAAIETSGATGPVAAC
jgi:hypothetical protein